MAGHILHAERSKIRFRCCHAWVEFLRKLVLGIDLVRVGADCSAQKMTTLTFSAGACVAATFIHHPASNMDASTISVKGFE
jgi:hypothetical protein